MALFTTNANRQDNKIIQYSQYEMRKTWYCLFLNLQRKKASFKYFRQRWVGEIANPMLQSQKNSGATTRPICEAGTLFDMVRDE